jgi:hypothetical protein
VPASARASLLRPALFGLLGVWLGALLVFALVARAAFAVGATPEIAGHLVGRVLGPLELGGAGAGVALAALGGRLRAARWAVALPLVLSAVCLLSHFGVSPALAEIRLAAPDAAPDVGRRFARLHRLSVGLYAASVLGVLALGLLHARAEVAAVAPPRPGERREG